MAPGGVHAAGSGTTGRGDVLQPAMSESVTAARTANREACFMGFDSMTP